MRILFHVVNRDDDLYQSWLKHERCEHLLFISNFPFLGKDTMCLSRRNLRLEKVVEVLVLLPNPLRGTRQFEKECSAQLSSLYETVH